MATVIDVIVQNTLSLLDEALQHSRIVPVAGRDSTVALIAL